MEGYQKRIAEEKFKLDTKIEALEEYLTKDDLCPKQAELLIPQHKYMLKYSNLLGQRIQRFK